MGIQKLSKITGVASLGVKYFEKVVWIITSSYTESTFC